MLCLNNTEDNHKRVDDLASQMSIEEDGSFSDAVFESNRRKAHHMLCCNNGNAMHLTPDQKPSKLFEDLLKFTHNNQKAAILLKSIIYTGQWIDKHGDWMWETGQEPTMQEVLEEYGLSSHASFPGLYPSGTIQDINATEIDTLNADLLALSAIYGSKQDTIESLWEENSEVEDQIRSILQQKLQQQVQDVLSGYDIDAEVRDIIAANPSLAGMEDTVKQEVIQKHTRQTEREWAVNIIQEQCWNAATSLADLWGIHVNADGVVADNPFPKSNDYLSDYWIYEYRANFIEFLTRQQIDHNNFNLKLAAVIATLEDPDPRYVSNTVFAQFLELFKDSPLMRDLLINSGMLVQNSKGEYTKKSIDDAYDKFTKEVSIAADPYLTGKKPFAHNLRSWLSEVWNEVIGKGIVKINDTTKGFVSGVLAASSAIVFFNANFIVGLGIGLAIKYAINTTTNAIRSHIQSTFKSYTTYRQASLNLVLGQFVYRDFFDESEDIWSLVNEDKKPDDNDAVYNVLSAKQRDGMYVSLAKLRKSLISQIKAMESAADKDIHSEEQIAKYKELLRLCNVAMTAPVESRENDVCAFASRYINVAKQEIFDAVQKLNEFNQNGPESVDIHQLMRIKTEVLGAFNAQLSQNLLVYYKHYPYAQFKNTQLENSFVTDLQQYVQSEMQNALNLFNQTLNNYLDWYVRQVIGETAAKQLQKGQRDRLYTNVKHWLNSEIGNGKLSTIEKFITPARTAKSPVIRLVLQKMEEIEQNARAEAEPILAELEQIRIDERSLGSRLNPLNVLNKYCERDDEGRFTGYFKSDIKRGVYYKQYKEERDFLIDKYGIIKEADGSINWDKYEEDVYIRFNKDLIIWQAGGTRVADPSREYIYPSEGQEPRIIRRFDWRYYYNKVDILGRYGTEKLSIINQSIARILNHKDYQETIMVNGVAKKIPMVSKMPKSVVNELKALQIEKQQLSTIYKLKWDRNYENITDIIESTSDFDKKLATRFIKWNIYKRNRTIRNISGNHSIYDAVIKWFDDKINDPKLSEQEKTDLELQKKQFEKFNTKRSMSHKLKQFLGFDNVSIEDEDFYDDESRADEYKARQIKQLFNMIRSWIASDNEERNIDLSKLGETGNIENIRHIWSVLTKLNKVLSDLDYDGAESSASATTRFNRKQALKHDSYVKLLEDGVKTQTSFFVYLLQKLGLQSAIQQYQRDHNFTALKRKVEGVLTYVENSEFGSTYRFQELLQETVLNVEWLKDRRNPAKPEEPLFTDEDVFYENTPIGMYSEDTYTYKDNRYDEASDEYVQINPNRPEYNNSKEFATLSKDKYYEKMLEVMKKGWENYSGFTKPSKYLMPQREQSSSSAYGRIFSQGFGNMWANTKNAIGYTNKSQKGFTSRDEFVQDVLTRADGTVVEQIPARWTSLLDNTNTIDTDLVSSISDFYKESVKYKYRAKLEPVVEAFFFKLTGGFSGQSSDALTSDQADLLRDEINKRIYGRDVIGSGENGRLTAQEQKYAKRSQIFRSILHKRLMSHNWRSVLKNGFDSFCNMLASVYTGKYIRACNFANAIVKLFYDKENSNVTILTQLFGINRSKATNATQGFMHYFGTGPSQHERYENQNKWWVTRFLSQKVPTLEFEAVDYTSKALITESVLDAYRLMYNPITRRHEFLNESEAEQAYSKTDRKRGWEMWKASSITLRQMYRFNKKLGVIELRDDEEITLGNTSYKIIDLVRPRSKTGLTSDSRSRILETKVATTIRQMSGTINGMLDKQDKPTIARNYVGALITAFRGWMISQAGEFYKSGVDFYDYETDADCGGYIREKFNGSDTKGSQLRASGLFDKNLDGQYNWATGTIDVGLHKRLYRTTFYHFGAFLQMMIPIFEISSSSKFRHLKHMTTAEYHQLRNFAAATDFFLITTMMTCLLFSWYSGDGDGDDDGDDNNEKDPFVEAYNKMNGTKSGKKEKPQEPRDFGKGMKSLTWASALASISERFSQLGGSSFLLGASDIIKGVTVGTTIMDDAKYLLTSMYHVANLLDPREQITDETNELLINGSFKGKTKGQKALTYILADLGVDILPYTLALDAYDAYFGQQDPNNLWSDYSLNFYKTTTESGNKGSAKWYGEEIVPTSLIYKPWNTNRWFNSQLGPAKKEKKKSSEDEVKFTPIKRSGRRSNRRHR